MSPKGEEAGPHDHGQPQSGLLTRSPKGEEAGPHDQYLPRSSAINQCVFMWR